MDKSNCLLHSGATSSSGYGKVKREGKFWDRHRYEYYRVHGPIPEGMVVRHRCHNRLCYNVDHLVLGSQKDNVHDSLQEGRLERKLSEQQVVSIIDRYTGKRGEQSALAKEYGVSANLVNKIVNGKRRETRRLHDRNS